MHGTGVSSAIIGSSLHENYISYARKFGSTVMVIGEGVWKARPALVDLYAAGMGDPYRIHIRDGEESKTFKAYSDLICRIASTGIGRSDLITYIGGGTIGDITGFAASTYMRGIRLCAIPTTLLAQVDSSIGGKNGINVSGIKNIAGTFYNPERIFCDTEFLREMPDDMLKDSLSEVIKYGLTGDPEITRILKRHSSARELIETEGEILIARSITVKKNIVEMDPLETREVRQSLNAGHTVAHAIEGATSNAVSHGKAVLIGLMAEAYISDKLNGRDSGISDIVREIADLYSIDYSMPEGITEESLLDFASKDKKIEGDSIVFPVMISPGKVQIRRLDAGRILELIEEWHRKIQP